MERGEFNRNFCRNFGGKEFLFSSENKEEEEENGANQSEAEELVDTRRGSFETKNNKNATPLKRKRERVDELCGRVELNSMPHNAKIRRGIPLLLFPLATGQESDPQLGTVYPASQCCMHS